MVGKYLTMSRLASLRQNDKGEALDTIEQIDKTKVKDRTFP